MSNAGNFRIDVSGPYPCWCELSHGDKKLSTFLHSELSDLKYAVEKAMQEAALKSDRIAEEVYLK